MYRYACSTMLSFCSENLDMSGWAYSGWFANRNSMLHWVKWDASGRCHRFPFLLSSSARVYLISSFVCSFCYLSCRKVSPDVFGWEVLDFESSLLLKCQTTLRWAFQNIKMTNSFQVFYWAVTFGKLLYCLRWLLTRRKNAKYRFFSLVSIGTGFIMNLELSQLLALLALRPLKVVVWARSYILVFFGK